ncbi:MAG: HYR domain-containing protein [Sediminibacterium sp.]|nr:HYR domain-containing protein [Sediminibacterium sp.]
MKKGLLRIIYSAVFCLMFLLAVPSIAADFVKKLPAISASVAKPATVGDLVTKKSYVYPIIFRMGQIGVVNDPGLCGAIVPLIPPYAYDSNGLPVTITNDAPAFFSVGTTVITWTVTDAAGNFDTTTQKVTVIDNELPSIQIANVTVNNTIGLCGASVNLGIPVTSDNCGVVSVTNDAPSFFPVGTTLVTWTVTDKAGYTNTTIQSVTVTDTQKPFIKAPSSKTVSVTSRFSTVSNIKLGLPSTSDNCGVKSVTNNAPLVYSVGTTYVTWTVTDVNENTATAIQKVTVKLGSTRNKSTGTENNNSIVIKTARENEVMAPGLKITVTPNPSTSYFTLKLDSKYSTPIMLRVTDALGRVVDARSNLTSNTTVQIGQTYQAGLYYAEIVQGPQRKVVQLIKVR